VGASVAFAFNLNVYLYFSAHHGMFFEFGSEGFGSGSSQTLLNATGTSGTLSGLTEAVGYSYRNYFTKNWEYVYDIGIGSYSYLPSTNARWDTIGSGFEATQKFSVDYRFGQLVGPTLTLDGLVGLAIYQIWVPSASGSISASGNSFGALTRFKFGF